ncbi:MAG: class I SAM-dependent methyltransferase [Myxococcota bacterium]
MSDFDRTKWETRYQQGRGYEAEPHPFLAEVAPLLPASGLVLDLAGGTGRHARWFARRGYEVTLADISATALAKATERAEAEGLSLDTVEIDLDTALPPGPWHVVVVSFFLVRGKIGGIVSRLAPGGLLVLIHPTMRNLERHEKPSEVWLLRDGELDEGLPGLTTLHHWEGWTTQNRHEVHYVGRRPA